MLFTRVAAQEAILHHILVRVLVVCAILAVDFVFSDAVSCPLLDLGCDGGGSVFDCVSLVLVTCVSHFATWGHVIML